MRLKNLLEEEEEEEEEETGEAESSNIMSSFTCGLAMVAVFLKLVVSSSSTLNLMLSFFSVVVDFSNSAGFDFLNEKARNF